MLGSIRTRLAEYIPPDRLTEGREDIQRGGCRDRNYGCLGVGKRDFRKSQEKFLSADEISLSWIQEVRATAIEGVRINYGDEGKD